ncbi:MAG: gamma-glutamyltransferase [Dehalococcoidia bacterium]|nr:gamma-glutamyltransferase [Dehalococcoidia bacterium]MSQ35149.1 gamma-glutamyltransferase [Dehalococcoidia bacterium]
MKLSRPVLAHEEIQATGGMAVAQHPLGARIGVEVLERGGNAIDAAVTTAFAMGVLQPYMNGLGGGGQMVIHLAEGDPAVVYYGMMAPALARPDMYELEPGAAYAGEISLQYSRSFAWPKVRNEANTRGHSSIAVPGTAAGLCLALEKWGTMTLDQALTPAIRLAEEGFTVGHHFALASLADRATLLRHEGTAAVFCPGGNTVPNGGRLVQKDHARTLKLVAKNGPDGFYKGETAQRISQDCASHGGTLRAGDLAAYKALVLKPVLAKYRGFELLAASGPTAGTTCVEILQILQYFDLAKLGWGSASALHFIIEATRLAAADRFTYMGDCDGAPWAELAAARYAESRAKKIAGPRAVDPVAGDPWETSGGKRPKEFPASAGAPADSGTTHITVVDRKRNAVSLTQTNYGYSGVVHPGVGIMMNNGMGWFYPAPGTVNSVAPGRRGLNNMTPIVLLKDGRLHAALGASGGRRIWTAVSQTIVNFVDFGMTLQEAMQAPRLHVETDDVLLDGRFGLDVRRALERRGHVVEMATPHFDRSPYAEPNGIWRDGRTLRSGVYPVAKPTYAAGYPGGENALSGAEGVVLAPRPDLHP